MTCQKINRRWRYNGSGYKGQMIYNAIQKYGWENIKHKILYEHLTKDEAEQKEIELISRYKSNKIKYGYNIDNGGNHQGKMSEETKRKLSKIFLGRKISEEAHKKQIKNIPKKSVYQFDKCGRKINQYISSREASRLTGISCSSIVKCCNKKENFKTVGGYIWSYENKINIDDYIDKKIKKVIQYKDNLIINIWDSLKKIADYYNISKSTASEIVRENKIFDGYYWRYASEQERNRKNN